MNKKVVLSIATTTVALIVLATILISSGSAEKMEEPNMVFSTDHYNVTIAPDLSNRVDMSIHSKPTSDIDIIDGIIQDIEHVYLKSGHRKINQKDRFVFSFINNGLIELYDIDQTNIDIDFSVFTKQLNRINYIKNREEYAQNGLKEDVQQYKNECREIYKKAELRTAGADIWSYFNTHIDLTQVKQPEEPKLYDGKEYQDTYRNVLILLTDGYIESGIYDNATNNLSYDLSKNRVDSFRKAYKNSGMSSMEEFFRKNEYGIVPITNKYLGDLEVLVLELDDRSLTKAGNATVHPTDAEIIELFWSNWLTQSGVKKFELHSCFDNVKEANKTIRRFLMTE